MLAADKARKDRDDRGGDTDEETVSDIDFPQNEVICGCVDNELEGDLKQILLHYRDAREKEDSSVYYTVFIEKNGWQPKYVEALLTILDNAGLIEHGTAIRGSWITEKGIFVANGGDLLNDPIAKKFT